MVKNIYKMCVRERERPKETIKERRERESGKETNIITENGIE